MKRGGTPMAETSSQRLRSANAPRAITRRHFLAAGAVAAFAAPRYLRAQNANSKLNIAMIGVGGRGGSNLGSVSGENIVALCDVNSRALDTAAAKYSKARREADF